MYHSQDALNKKKKTLEAIPKTQQDVSHFDVNVQFQPIYGLLQGSYFNELLLGN